MALKKSDLRAVLKNEDSTAEEKISEILNLLHEEVDSVKDERDELKNQILELKEKADNKNTADSSELDAWKEKYNKEHEAFENFKTEQTEKANKTAKETAYKEALKAAGVSDKAMDLILDGSKAKDFINGLELDEDGKVKDLDSVTKTIKAEYAGFITSENTQGANTQTPPANDGGSVTKEAFSKMGYNDRVKLFNENRELYDSLTKGE